MLAGQDELALLIVDGRAHDDHAGGTLADQFDDLEHRIEGIAGHYRPEKFGRWLDDPDERIRYLVRKPTRAGRREAQHLQAVRQRAGKAARPAEFDVVMDRMVVAGHGLKRREVRVRHRAARARVTLRGGQGLEPTLRRNRVPRRIESLVDAGHAGSLRAPVMKRSAEKDGSRRRASLPRKAA